MLTSDQIEQLKSGMNANTSMPSPTQPATHEWVDSLSGSSGKPYSFLSTPNPKLKEPSSNQKDFDASVKSTINQAKEGFQTVQSGAKNTNVAQGAATMARGALNEAGAGVNAIFTPITAALNAGSKLPGVSQTLDAIKKHVIDPAADKLSNNKLLDLQGFMKDYPHADEVAGNLISIAMALGGGEAKEAELPKMPEPKIKEPTIPKSPGPDGGTPPGKSPSIFDQISKKINDKLNPDQETKIANRTKDLGKIENSKASIRNYVAKNEAKGFNPKADIASTDLLTQSVDNTGTIRTKQPGGAIDEYNAFIKPQEDIVSKVLEKEGTIVNLADVQNKMLNALNESNIKGSAKSTALNGIKREIAGLALDADHEGNIPLATIHDAKVSKYANINYNVPESGTSDKLIAKTLKTFVEDNSSAEVAKLNQELSRHYANIGYLEKLDGAKVANGRLGKHFKSILGGMIGSHFGPLGTIAGAEAGAKLAGATMESTFSKDIGKNLESSQGMKNALESTQSLKKEGPLKTNQATTINATKKPIEPSIKQTVEKATGDFPRFKNIEPAEKLSSADRAIENKALEHIKNDPQGVIDAYKSLKEVEGGKIANTDWARKIFGEGGKYDVGYRGHNSMAVQEPASAIAKAIWDEGLKKKGEAWSFAGGSGTGKTTATRNVLPDELNRAAVVFDGNLSSTKSLMTKVKEANQAGKPLNIAYTYRDPIASFKGTIERGLNNPDEGGRMVPGSVVADNHIGSHDAIFDLLKKIQDGTLTTDNAKVKLINNDLGSGKQALMTTQEFEKLKYPSVKELKTKFDTVAKQYYDSGKINKEQYETLLK